MNVCWKILVDIWNLIRGKAKAKPLTAAVAANGLSGILGVLVGTLTSMETYGVLAYVICVLVAGFIAYRMDSASAPQAQGAHSL